MIEISTPAQNQLCTSNAPDANREQEGLSEEDQRFYSSVKEGLDQLSKSPRNGTVDKLLAYSRSL